jgi:predicted N-acetyltransferase YhbS
MDPRDPELATQLGCSVRAVLREMAEYPNSFGPLAEGDERIDTGRYTLCLGAGPTWNTVQRQRFPLQEVDEVLAEVWASYVRGDGPGHSGRSAARPRRGLVDTLLERELVPDKDPYAVAVVLTREPPPADSAFSARRVETLEELTAAARVEWEAFEATREEIEVAQRLLPERFRESVNLRHAVWLDGEIVCTGTATPTEHGLLLYGGATLPRSRGRGAYRALVRARWDDAAALGTPALITQGGAMSRPILERLGFERVGEVHTLLGADVQDSSGRR